MSSGSLPRIKLDLSKNEILVDALHTSPFMHRYSDEYQVKTQIHSYSIEEMFAEKCRALVERTRPRDLYDVVHLHELFFANQTSIANFMKIIFLKFDHKGLKFPNDFEAISPDQFIETKESWSHMLDHQINQLKDVDEYIQKYQTVLEWLRSHLESPRTRIS